MSTSGRSVVSRWMVALGPVVVSVALPGWLLAASAGAAPTTTVAAKSPTTTAAAPTTTHPTTLPAAKTPTAKPPAFTLDAWQQAVGPATAAVQTVVASLAHGVGPGGTVTAPLTVSGPITSGVTSTQQAVHTLATQLPTGRLRTDVKTVAQRSDRLMGDLASGQSLSGAAQYTWAGRFLTDAYHFEEAGARVVDLLPPVSTARNRALVARYQDQLLAVSHAADSQTVAVLAIETATEPTTAQAGQLLDSLASLERSAKQALALPPTGNNDFKTTWKTVMGQLAQGAGTELKGIESESATTLAQGESQVTAVAVELLALDATLHLTTS